MALSFTDPEKWDKQYERASKKQRYEMLLKTIEQPLSKEFIEKLDLGMCLVETKGDLLSHNLIPELLDFIKRLQEQQPEFYQKEFYYYDDFLVTYYLFRNDPENVAESLVRFMGNPVDSIEELIVVLAKLVYYGYADLAEQVSLKAYLPVGKSPKLIGGAEWEFVHVLLTKMVHNMYLKIRNGEKVDWQAFAKKAKKYGFRSEEVVPHLQRCLTEDMKVSDKLVMRNKKQRQDILGTLTWEFCRYMFEQKQMDFVCSEQIWDQTLRFWEETKGSSKSGSPEKFFTFSKQSLDQYLAQLASGFMSRRQDHAVAVLWGIPYIYDFLLAKQIIPQHVHQDIIGYMNTLKPELMNAFRTSLWEYDFVHRWTPPDSVSAEDFVTEAEQFKATIDKVTPF